MSCSFVNRSLVVFRRNRPNENELKLRHLHKAEAHRSKGETCVFWTKKEALLSLAEKERENKNQMVCVNQYM